MKDPAGSVLRGRLQLVERIGQGAMGSVWRGIDAQTSRAVAVKLLKSPSAAATTLFLREIEALVELRHPHIVAYVDHGLAEAGEPYLAMEWLEGTDLQTYLLTHRLSSEEANVVATQVLSALAIAHGRGIVHRDLKPANIFLCGGDIAAVKLLDFGVAKRLLDAPSQGARVAVGTPLYMSPEQARGLADIDGRSDIFSLGTVLYEALTGTSPFLGATASAVLAKVCLEETAPLRQTCPQAPAALEKLLSLMLAKKRSLRPQDAEQLLTSFSQLRSDEAKDVATFVDSLSSQEQRVVTVSMSKLPSATNQSGLPKSLGDALKKMDAELNQLVDGTLLITCHGNTTATELAAKSARCALAIRRHNSDACTAISMGRTVVRQGLPLGKLLDETSARLLNALPGEISLDEETAGLIGRAFAITIHANKWLLVDDAYATPLPVTGAGERVFVGRTEDLARLSNSFTDAATTHSLKLALITGVAGNGKTGLANEWLLQLRQQGQRFRLWRAQGDAMQALSPLGLVRQLAMNALGIAESLPRKARREMVAGFLKNGGEVGPESAHYLADLVGATPTPESEFALRPVRSDPRMMAEQMTLAFGDALRVASEASPLVVLLDDMQWADAASVKLLCAALRQVRDKACFVLLLGRPELEQNHVTLWTEHRPQTWELSPLDHDESVRLIGRLLSADLADNANWVAERADGNPFFIEELARTLKRRGKTQIPDAVLGTVQGRLDDLPSPARRILRAASIYGRHFAPDALPTMLGDQERLELSHWLEFLVKEDVLTTAGLDSFSFRQELTREATYQSLTDGDRVLGHRLAGKWLEAQGNTPPSVLLEHYTRACDSPYSCVLHQSAAEHAFAAGDLESALGFAVRGHQFGPEPLQAGLLRLIESHALRWLGRMKDGWAPVQEAMRLLIPGSAPWFTAVEYGAVMLGEGANEKELLELSFTAVDTAAADESAIDARTNALAAIAGGLLCSPYMQEAEALLLDVESADPERLRPETQCRLLNVRGNHEKRNGRIGKARAHHELCLQQAIACGNMLIELDARSALSGDLMDAGLFDAAKVFLEQNVAFARRLRSPLFEGLALANIGAIAMLRGSLDDAEQAFTKTSALFRNLGATWLDLGLGLYIAHLAILRNNGAAARTFVEPFLKDPTLVVPYRPYALALAARIEMLDGNAKEARRLAEEGRRLLDDEGLTAAEGESYLRLTLVEALLQDGAHDRAADVLRDATKRLQAQAKEIGDPTMETGFVNIPVHRTLFDMVANLERPQ